MNRDSYASGKFKKPPRAIKKRTKTQREASAYSRVMRHPDVSLINSDIAYGFTPGYVCEEIRSRHSNKRLHLPFYVVRAYMNQLSK